ncbi:MAG TPA: ribose-5-phosphate isomerase RpiA [Stellaceae bacterium]|jgi:ribose 5-phosphate isomerase A|nr:ribose-5-phosphate isomerase RpiA [Stellaceae bacterium]
MSDRDIEKQHAATRAVEEVRDGMVLGLGSGSTVALVLEALAKRVAGGLKIAGIPSSERTAAAARRLGIPLTDFTAHRRLDLTIDGADQIARGSLDLVKGLGGALLREKMIALASDRMIVVADQSKLVERLGGATPLPVEIVRFGWPATLDRLAATGAAPVLRRDGAEAFVTDNGNYIADCGCAAIPDPAALDHALRALFGVVATGLFCGLASMAIIGTPGGVGILRRELAL